jgi:hypothetical protein
MEVAWLLYPQGKSPWYPLGRRLGEPQSWSGHGVEEKNSQPPSHKTTHTLAIVSAYVPLKFINTIHKFHK